MFYRVGWKKETKSWSRRIRSWPITYQKVSSCYPQREKVSQISKKMRSLQKTVHDEWYRFGQDDGEREHFDKNGRIVKQRGNSII